MSSMVWVFSGFKETCTENPERDDEQILLCSFQKWDSRGSITWMTLCKVSLRPAGPSPSRPSLRDPRGTDLRPSPAASDKEFIPFISSLVRAHIIQNTHFRQMFKNKWVFSRSPPLAGKLNTPETASLGKPSRWHFFKTGDKRLPSPPPPHAAHAAASCSLCDGRGLSAGSRAA